MWAGNLAISSGLWALESPTLGKGGNRDPWEKLGVGQGGQARLPLPLCQFPDQLQDQRASSSSPEPFSFPGIHSKRHPVWEVTGGG